MLYLNHDTRSLNPYFFKDLTLTSVVFEYKKWLHGLARGFNLTLTSVVFELTLPLYFPSSLANLTLTSVVFE